MILLPRYIPRCEASALALAAASCVFLSLLSLATPSSAAGRVGWEITEDTTWDLLGSPYEVAQTVIVLEGATLTIEPGVEVRFASGTWLQVGTTAETWGTLVARGMEGDPIVLTADTVTPVPAFWNGVQFMLKSEPGIADSDGEYESGSILEWCEVSYGGPNISCIGASPLILHCTAREGSAVGGGGIFLSGSDALVSDCHIVSNEAVVRGGGLCCYTGGNPRIISCRLEDNYSLMGGGLSCYRSDASLQGLLVLGNQAWQGGGLHIRECQPEVNSCVVVENQATQYGGGIACLYAEAFLSGCTVVGNAGVLSGGGIDAQVDAILHFANCLIAENHCSVGGGLYIGTGSNVSLEGCNLWRNTDEQIRHYGAADAPSELCWWGSFDAEVIADGLFDCHSHPAHWCVEFEPSSPSPNLNAPGKPSQVDTLLIWWEALIGYESPAQDSVFGMELRGVDGNPWCRDETGVDVGIGCNNKSEIRVSLVETDSSSGVYRGSARVGSVTNDTTDVVAASVGDTLVVIPQAAPWIQASLVVGGAGEDGVASGGGLPSSGQDLEVRLLVDSAGGARIICWTPNAGHLWAAIYDVRGRLVWRWPRREAEADAAVELVWDGCYSKGAHAAPGIYYVRIELKDRSAHATTVKSIAFPVLP